MHRLKVLATVVVIVTGCTPPTRSSITTSTVPCGGKSEIRVELGRSLEGNTPATFTTNGTVLRIVATAFTHGGLFDPKKGITQVSIGPKDRPPTHDPQRNIITNVTKQIDVRELEPETLQLDAGSYWLWSSTAGAITITSCDTALTDVTPSP
jgi:hypothetical protein